MKNAFISICIPAYKRVDFLRKLLDSIAIQKFRDFDVVVTDDSPTDEVRLLCEKYTSFTLHYYKNVKTLGTPANWNECICKSKGEWIKLMHDDDWFSSELSLERFAEFAKRFPGKFLFSAYTNWYSSSGNYEKKQPAAFRLNQLKKNPLTLLSSNIIGPPSVTMHPRAPELLYDINLKWLVDIEYYNRRLKSEKFEFINEYLVHVGLSPEQVTMMCHSNPDVEIPENSYLLRETGISHLKNIMIYDAWWRLIRNLGVKSVSDFKKYYYSCPTVIEKIIKDVNHVPGFLVKKGPFSKMFMTMSYLKNRSSIK